MRRRNLYKTPKRTNPYAPLILYGFIALTLFIAFQLVESAMCEMMAIAIKNAPCTAGLPPAMKYVPLVFVLLGVIGTAWRLARLKSFPEIR